MTLPLVLAVERAPDLLDVVRSIHLGDDSPLEHVRERVLASGACDEVRKLADAKTARALEVLRPMPRSDARSLLEEVATSLSHRRE
jgi:geranylgeranyl pyrophosphate synthase